MEAIILKVATPIVAALTAWLFGRKSGTDSIKPLDLTSARRAIEAAFLHEIDESLEQQLSAAAVRYRLEDAAWVVLDRMHLPKNTITKRLVGEVVELAVAEFRAKAKRFINDRAAKLLPAELDKLQAATRDMAKAFEPPPPDKRTVPPLGLDIEEVK